MKTFLLVCSVSASLLFPFHNALAASPYVACSQQGLLDAGYDPNGIDGNIGPGTKAAAAAFRADNGQNLPDLSETSAAEWCLALEATTFVIRLENAVNFDGTVALSLLEWQMEDVVNVGGQNNERQFINMTIDGEQIRVATISKADWEKTSHVIINAWGSGWRDVTDWEQTQYNIADTRTPPTPGDDGIHEIIIRLERE